jgi:hypothetical protein
MTDLKKLQKEQSSPQSTDLHNKTDVYDTTSHALLMEIIRIWEEHFTNVRTSVENTSIGQGEQIVKVK